MFPLLFIPPFILPSLLFIIYKPPKWLISKIQSHWPAVIFRVPMPDTNCGEPRRMVALTIDDGPSEYTAEIGRILRAYNINATFFIIGSQAEESRYATVLQQLLLDENELGNHAMLDQWSCRRSDADLKAQIQRVDQIIESIYQLAKKSRPGKYFRPGSGFFHQRMLKLLLSLGYTLVLGSIYPHDAQIRKSSLNAKHILSQLQPGGVIICHDRQWTLAMLRKILPEIKNRGYEVVPLTKLIEASPSKPGVEA